MKFAGSFWIVVGGAILTITGFAFVFAKPDNNKQWAGLKLDTIADSLAANPDAEATQPGFENANSHQGSSELLVADEMKYSALKDTSDKANGSPEHALSKNSRLIKNQYALEQTPTPAPLPESMESIAQGSERPEFNFTAPKYYGSQDHGFQDHSSQDHGSQTHSSQAATVSGIEQDMNQVAEIESIEPETGFNHEPNLMLSESVADQSITHSNASFDFQNVKVDPVIAQRVRQQTEYGTTLARRGATFAARDEFVSALRMVAESLDQAYSTREFSDSLYKGFIALDEADDFVGQNSETFGMDLESICAGHQTVALAGIDLENTTPQRAMQEYYSYAEKRLAEACGSQAAAAPAFYCLAKTFTVSLATESNSSTLNIPKSIVMFRLASAVNPQDFQSRNELAVLMARNGRWQQAKQYLLESLQIKRTPAAWHNLAQVHSHLNETELANSALTEYQMTLNGVGTTNPGQPQVRWVSPQQMEQMSAQPALADSTMPTRIAEANQIQQPVPQQINQPQPSSKKRNWLNPIKKIF